MILLPNMEIVPFPEIKYPGYLETSYTMHLFDLYAKLSIGYLTQIQSIN